MRPFLYSLLMILMYFMVFFKETVLQRISDLEYLALLLMDYLNIFLRK